MFSDHLILQGKHGVKRVSREGPYTVIANKQLYEWGKAGKFAVVNEPEAWVDSVHDSFNEAAARAHRLYQR